MELLVNLLVLLVALLHGYFLVLEMFLWDKPKGMKVFGLTPEKAVVTKVMAANQGGVQWVSLSWFAVGVVPGQRRYRRSGIFSVVCDRSWHLWRDDGR